MGFLASLLSFQVIIQSAFCLVNNFIISLNTGLQGSFADCVSFRILITSSHSLLAIFKASCSCASIDSCCLSHLSVDFLQYIIVFIVYLKIK
ncbi:hypothetical protein CSA08_02465 [Candidatus Gracilibacteria bacterium]|nr:MAG: hypothetical protein CSA08_02465 [Candidatus Gracilibacteria bacterium]